jgi:hypothetical protein
VKNHLPDRQMISLDDLGITRKQPMKRRAPQSSGGPRCRPVSWQINGTTNRCFATERLCAGYASILLVLSVVQRLPACVIAYSRASRQGQPSNNA